MMLAAIYLAHKPDPRFLHIKVKAIPGLLQWLGYLQGCILSVSFWPGAPFAMLRARRCSKQSSQYTAGTRDEMKRVSVGVMSARTALLPTSDVD